MDICSGPFEFGKKFDVIYSSHSIEHVLNPEYTLLNLKNALKDDGLFFLILPYPDEEAANPDFDHRYKIHCGVTPLKLHILDNGNSTSKILENIGFKIIKKEFFSYREPEIHLTLKNNTF
jgi:SAM-dependent methyltransferase